MRSRSLVGPAPLVFPVGEESSIKRSAGREGGGGSGEEVGGSGGVLVGGGGEGGGDVVGGEGEVAEADLACGGGHGRDAGGVLGLRDDDPAGAADRAGAEGAVRAGAGEDDGDRGRTGDARDGGEEEVGAGV